MSSNFGSNSKESVESWESLFRKTLSKDRLLNFTKPIENPIQWIHLLDPFDHQETRTASSNTFVREGLSRENSPKKSHTSGDKIPNLKFPEAVVALAQAAAKASGESRGAGSVDLSGWPLIPFSKVQMFKCEKCCLEFCSPVNHRRHLRVKHRRAAQAEKEDLKSQRQQLATFWDALSLDEASKIVDVKNLVLEDLVGERVAKALSRLLQQPALFALPHSYVKSGAMLLELVQRRSFKPVTSSELFKILDGSSEKTFPSFGLNAMQRYIFDGEAGKVGLEAKNLVSSLGFLLELNLVKAFIKDKDEEAWRCQTALVEEEEASQRRRAQMQERKRMKKARQKDSKEKEQKHFDSMRAFLSTGSESSDEERHDANSIVGYDQQSSPSCNAYENLHHRLAGEENDVGRHLEEGLTLTQVPAENDQLSEAVAEADGCQHHSVAVSTIVQDYPVHGSPSLDSAEAAGLEPEVHSTTKDSSIISNAQAVSGLRRPVFKEKRKYPAEQIPEVREFAPFEKTFWKEKHSSNFSRFSGQRMVNSVKEGMDLAHPGVVLEEFPVNRVAGYRPRQVMGKPVRSGKYLTAVQTGTAIWTKKASKLSDTACNITPVLTDTGNSTVEVDSDHVASAEVPETRAEVTAVDSLQEIVINSPLSTAGSCDPSQHLSLAVGDGCVCNLESHPPSTSYMDCGNEPDQLGHTPSTLSSVVVGSVVIGSVCLPLVDCMAGQGQSSLQFNSLEDVSEERKLLQASEGESTGSLRSLEKVEESLRALNENGAVNCMPYKENEWNGKALKLLSQVDSEEKENHEHPPHVAGELNLSRPKVVHAGVKGGRVKVWRPVTAITSHESQDRCGSVSSAVTGVLASQTSMVEPASISESVDPEELEQGQPTLDNNTVSHAPETSSKLCLKNEGGVFEELSTPASTFEAVRGFLSQRWSTAVKASDTVYLILEDEEECESQSLEPCEETVHMKDSRNRLLQANKHAPRFPGNGKNLSGFWKQGCPGSAMAASKRLSGRNNFHVAPRFRYVPK
ncbi:hypothetical protein L7F22_055635 [Adiantum nelumboides]|nr:hypothetical protein [Adiantum nelumboides]